MMIVKEKPADKAGFFHGLTGMPSICGESPQGAQLPANPIATCKVCIVRYRREEAIAKP